MKINYQLLVEVGCIVTLLAIAVYVLSPLVNRTDDRPLRDNTPIELGQ